MVNRVTQVINEYVEKKLPQERALQHTESDLKREGESARNTNLRDSLLVM
jgi:hypothetical protein